MSRRKTPTEPLPPGKKKERRREKAVTVPLKASPQTGLYRLRVGPKAAVTSGLAARLILEPQPNADSDHVTAEAARAAFEAREGQRDEFGYVWSLKNRKEPLLLWEGWRTLSAIVEWKELALEPSLMKRLKNALL